MRACGTIHLHQLSTCSDLCGSGLISYSYWHWGKPLLWSHDRVCRDYQRQMKGGAAVWSLLLPSLFVPPLCFSQPQWAPWTLAISDRHWHWGHQLTTLSKAECRMNSYSTASLWFKLLHCYTKDDANRTWLLRILPLILLCTAIGTLMAITLPERCLSPSLKASWWLCGQADW